MSQFAIRVEDLSKNFYLGHSREKETSLRNVLAASVKRKIRAAADMLRGRRQQGSGQDTLFWALKNVSLEIEPGQVVGVIGRNGAGKSTFLKVLSRITEPTSGRVLIRGRVGSLLEVGTGFHGDLSGRDNVFMNGAILGMKRAEIARKFDQIVAFAEVERFIDTPVKRYSSGMYMRLAFAVAAHLESEILLVDEVLTVGDSKFQKKCLGQIDQAAQQGRTVLLVSHMLNQIRRLCGQCVWLSGGQLRMMGATGEVLNAYEAEGAQKALSAASAGAGPKGAAQFVGWEIVEPRSSERYILDSMEAVTVRFYLQIHEPVRYLDHEIALFNMTNELMWAVNARGQEFEPGLYALDYRFPGLPLLPGRYYWQGNLYNDRQALDSWHGVPEMEISTPLMTHTSEQWQGVLNLPFELEISRAATDPVLETVPARHP